MVSLQAFLSVSPSRAPRAQIPLSPYPLTPATQATQLATTFTSDFFCLPRSFPKVDTINSVLFCDENTTQTQSSTTHWNLTLKSTKSPVFIQRYFGLLLPIKFFSKSLFHRQSFRPPDSLREYWVSPVKMMPKLHSLFIRIYFQESQPSFDSQRSFVLRIVLY